MRVHAFSLSFVLLILLSCSSALAIEIIVDNTNSGFSLTGSWSTSTSNCYGNNLYYRAPGTGANKATWTATVPAGWYRIDFYAGKNSTYATDAHYSVTDNDGVQAITKSQRVSATGWYFLGTHYFSGTAKVTLTDQYSGGSRVVADAVRLQSIFSFVQMSDSHIGYTQGTIDANTVAQELRTMRKVRMTPYGFDAPPPSFAIHSGDVTEFGQQYWDDAQSIFSGVPFPIYFVLGNHDVTQDSNRENLRALRGGPYYSFNYSDRGTNYHFVMFDSTLTQSPRATFTREALDWLAADLAALPANTGVFLNMHHPISSASDPKPYDGYRLLDTIRPYKVISLFCGHGHSFTTSVYDGLRWIEGGSTYDTGGGYNIVTVTNGVIDVAKKARGEANAATGLVKAMQIPATPSYPKVTVSSPVENSIQTGANVSISTSITGASGTVSAVAYELDGDANWRALTGTGPYTGTLDASPLVHGRHWVRVRYTMSSGALYYRTVSFWAWDGYPRARWICDLRASGLGAPCVSEGKVYVGANGGSLRCLDAAYGTQIWKVSLPSDVVSSPAVSDGRVVVGCGDGKVYCLNATTGATVWTTPCSGPVYSSPLVDSQTVYIGSNGTGAAQSAYLYSLDLVTGVENWRFPAGCAIESRPCVLGDTVFFGAWDSYFYAVDRTNGTLRWRYQRSTSRYNSPADSSPVASAASNCVFVADREYYMNAINAVTGAPAWTATSVAAQCLTPDGLALLQRKTTGTLECSTFNNAALWGNACSLDSTPVNPAVARTRAVVAGLHGLTSVVNLQTGFTEYQFQATQGYQVSGPSIDDEGAVYVPTIDGFLLCVANQDLPASPQFDIIIDNKAASVTGSWSTGTSAADKYGADYRYKSQGTGSAFLTFTPYISPAGNYRVYEWHSAGPNRATDLPHVVSCNSGTQTIRVNQQANGGTWNPLGLFSFAPGMAGNVRITDGFSGSGYVGIADAVRFVYDQVVSPPAAPSGLTAAPAGCTRIYLTWTDNASDESNYVVARSASTGGPYTQIATLPADATSYSDTGVMPNTAWYYVVHATNAGGSSTDSNEANATTPAPDVIIDNESATYTGTWTLGTSSADKYGADYRWAYSTSASTATFNANLPAPGNYLVQVWYPRGSNRANNVPYTVNFNGGSQTYAVNQQTNGGMWVTLGTHPFAAGGGQIVISTAGANPTVVCSDAVRFTYE